MLKHKQIISLRNLMHLLVLSQAKAPKIELLLHKVVVKWTSTTQTPTLSSQKRNQEKLNNHKIKCQYLNNMEVLWTYQDIKS